MVSNNSPGLQILLQLLQDTITYSSFAPRPVLHDTAIDEVPVSGMRLKEIVKVLQGRKDRQRALRVISSHAMTEFAMSNGTPS